MACWPTSTPAPSSCSACRRKTSRTRTARAASGHDCPSTPDFYGTLPLMPGAMTLFDAVRHLDPVILTGLPMGKWAAPQKVRWAAQHFPGTKIITTLARNKRDHAKPGDVLVDDQLKHRHLWEEMGGVFVHHQSVDETLPTAARIFRALSRELLADEIGARRSLGGRRPRRAERRPSLDRRAQLPGAQFHARPHARRRRRAVLPLQLRRARHRRHRRRRVQALPDPTQFDRQSTYYDRSRRPKNRAGCWSTCRSAKTALCALPELRATPELEDMLVLKKGNRLSITPVEPRHWQAVLALRG